MIEYRSEVFLELLIFQTKVVEKIKKNCWTLIIFVVAPCVLITLKFLSPTNAPLYYTYKMLKYTVKISQIAPTYFGPHRPSSGSLCRTLLKLQFCGHNQ